MNQNRIVKIQKLQDKNHMVGEHFSTLSSNEVRWTPWLGSAWYTGEEGEDEERNDYVEAHRDRIISTLQGEPLSSCKDSISFYNKNNKIIVILANQKEQECLLEKIVLKSA